MAECAELVQVNLLTINIWIMAVVTSQASLYPRSSRKYGQ